MLQLEWNKLMLGNYGGAFRTYGQDYAKLMFMERFRKLTTSLQSPSVAQAKNS